MKTVAIAIGVATFVAVIVFCYFFILHDTGGKLALHNIRKEGQNPSLVEHDTFSDQIVSQLKKYYGKTISQKSTQASLVGIRDFVVGTHPVNGRDLFYSILKRAFPDYADDIMKTLGRLDQYNSWV